jgi:hypothetical protein
MDRGITPEKETAVKLKTTDARFAPARVAHSFGHEPWIGESIPRGVEENLIFPDPDLILILWKGRGLFFFV